MLRPSLLTKLLAFAATTFVTTHSTLAESPTGVWRGNWSSQSTGHQGPMRANIRPDGAGAYDARFTGRFALIIPFTYKVKLVPHINSAGQTELRASKPLGPLLGSYSMQAVASQNGLNGSFQAAQDSGAVRMHKIR